MDFIRGLLLLCGFWLLKSFLENERDYEIRVYGWESQTSKFCREVSIPLIWILIIITIIKTIVSFY
jgi:hypothetical protein